MSQDWQLVFEIEGLFAPKQGVALDGDILLRGTKKSDDLSQAFFKVTVENEEEMRQKEKRVEEFLNRFLRIYSLLVGRHARIVGHSANTLGPEDPLGTRKFFAEFGIISKYNEQQVKRYTDVLNQTIAKFDSVKRIFEERGKSYLKNAIDYFYHALGDTRLEERLIDLMIAVESLFSKKDERQELRLRFSLRAAFLLSVGKEDERPNIFEAIYDLYGKRSKIVHGVEKVDLSYEEIFQLKSYVQEAIKRLINIKQEKDKFLALLDQAVYDEEKRKEVEQLISESHWETT